MKITFINVGYGDAILLETDSGYRALLDGGGNLPQEFQGDPYRIRCADYLKHRQIQRVDAVFVSHIHEDHVCGLAAVLEDVEAGEIFVPYPTEPFLQGRRLEAASDAPRSVPLYTAALNDYRDILKTAVQRGTPIRTLQAGDRLELAEDLQVSVLAPKPQAIRDYMTLVAQVYGQTDSQTVTQLLTRLDATSNHTSFLLRFDIGPTAFLTAADNCPSGWDEVDFSLLENVTVLKLPHHGQIDSISEQYMKDMPLRYVITTASSDRRYHSANPEVYQRLLAMRPSGAPPRFLFTDERSYPPYFHQPEGFQATTLVIDSGEIRPEFIKLDTEKLKEEIR